MLKTLLTFALALALTTQACTKGCLKCTTDDKCVLCDISQNYKLLDGACSTADQPNCALITLDGGCFVCEKNYYFDTVTSKCVAVETANVVTNCSTYNTSQSCVACDSNFYILEAKCATPTLISNCEDYVNANTCSSCKSGYYVALDGKTCSVLPGTSNCLNFSRFKCETCGTEFVYNQNLYFENFFNMTSTSEKNLVMFTVMQNAAGDKDISEQAVCQAVQVKNCLVYEDFKNCKECIANYFLKTDGTCEIYPTDIIENCLTYSSATTCSKCNQGFYLNSNLCTAVTTVTNCSQYSQTVNQCSLCNGDYYLSNNTCVKRVKSLGSLIANCKTKSLTTDKCGECNTGFNLSSDKEKCFTNQANCLLHNSATSSATEVTCNTCIDGYYLSGTTCTQGTDNNCITYETTSSACKVCKTGFYHPSNTCVEHINIANCLTYSQTVKNTCLTCQNNTYNFLIDKYCSNRTEIANCAVYNHGDAVSTCTTCNSGFKKDGDTSCVAITVTPNCAVETNGNCTKCNEGFALFESTTNNVTTFECKAAHDFILDECELAVVDDNGTTRPTSDVTCSYCKKNAFTIDFDDAYACIANDYLKVQNIEVNTQINGCLKMDTSTTCEMCSSGFFLNNDRSECLATGCGTQGAAQTYSAMTLNSDGGNPAKYNVKFTNHCAAAQATNVLVTAPNLDDLSGTVNIKCLDNKPTEIDIDIAETDYSNVNPNGTINNWISSPVDIFPAVICPTDKTHINGVLTTNLIDRCSYYFQYSQANGDNVKIGCLRCEHEYSGKAHDDGYIISCISNNFCKTDVTYRNLDVYWTKFLSCHKCDEVNKIPYVAALTGGKDSATITKFKPFTLTSKDWFVTDDDERYVNVCINNTSADLIRNDLKIDGAIANDKILFVANCGVGFLNLNFDGSDFDSTDVADTNLTLKQAILCAACLPGYKPTYRAGNKTVTACTAIENCTTSSTWFNACSSCASGYTYKINNGLIDYSECVAYSKDSNCYAYDSGAKECKKAAKGYFLNRDNFAEKVKAPRCKDSKFIPFYNFEDDSDARYNLFANSQGAGCNECESSYTAFKYSAGKYARYACAPSPFITTNITSFPKQPDDGTSVFINNCESYTNVAGNVGANGLVCQTCNANYVRRSDGSECLSLQTVSNCTTAANTGTKCIQCNDGYGLLTSGICVLGSIANCKTYNVNDSAAVATCKVCNPSYYLSNNTCLVGGVANCDVYSSQYKCDTCASGYILISESQIEGTGSASHNYCYPNDPALNCADATIINDTVGAKFTCTSCNQAYGVITSRTDTEAQTNCLSYNLIDNCKTYDLGSQLTLSTLYCVECNTGFYFDNLGSVCVKRTVLPAACKTYALDADKCSVCNDGNYITGNGKECIPFPTGVIGCRIYTDASTCTACDPDRWLNGNLCPLVESEAKISNCLYYSNDTTCSACQSGYFLSSNTCTALVVQNCLKVAAVNACESCQNGFVLKTENGNTNCVAYTKANCAVFEQTGTYPCIQCNQNFYVDANGDCQPSTIIANCIINDTKETCKQCGVDYAVAVDKKSCINKASFDTNCVQTIMPSSLNCSVCAPGYYFVNNVCTAFIKNTISEGCFSSSPTDDTVCHLCNTGYYMQKDQSCVKIDNGTTPEDTSDVTIIKSLFIALVSLMFLF